MSAPLQKFRIGLVTATVWKNEVEGGKAFYSVTLQRSYKDGDDWKETESLGHADLLCAIKLLERAEAFIAEQ